MREWSELADPVAGTRSTTTKVATVARYLTELPDAELPAAVTFLAGRPFPEADGRTTGLGWRAIADATERLAAEASAQHGVVAMGLGAAYDRSSDIGTAVEETLASAQHAAVGRPPGVAEVQAVFGAIAQARGPAAKTQLLVDLMRRCEPATARAVVKVLTGELRIGLRQGHLEAAVAKAFGRPLEEVQWAAMLTGDIGRTALLARHDELATATLVPFHPLTSMLASPVADETEALARMTPPVWVEDKYDGIRVQLHKVGDEVRLYSRELRDVSGQFPEIVRAAAGLPWDAILDGEILGWRDGAVLPFLSLQTRLGRKRPSERVQAEVPVLYVAFDALAMGRPGEPLEPLLRLPLRERRARLASLELEATDGFGLAALTTADDAAELATIFDIAQARGNEGLMVKDPESGYAPGRRGYAWLKLKKALTTLDCVVVGVEVGHGRRHGVLSDYTFAVIDDRPGAPDGRLVTIGKAYSGLTDAEIATMTRWFEAHTLSVHGRYRVVEPTVVVEIAFDVIQASTRHASGFAMRFPRIARIREDKTAAEADRWSTVAAIHARLQSGMRFHVLTVDQGAAEDPGA
ncbi:MAG: ATP-dependent DNA ligase [Chloroflexi bacterium]|nr:ATP-dependent DNA ligase [Chloroflexota bacterium]